LILLFRGRQTAIDKPINYLENKTEGGGILTIDKDYEVQRGKTKSGVETKDGVPEGKKNSW